MGYRADPAICNVCPVKVKCTTSDRGRTIQRSIYENYLDRVRGYRATEVYKKAIRKRQAWVEPMFAEAKEWHGLRRLRMRGLHNANIQGLLIALGRPRHDHRTVLAGILGVARSGASWRAMPPDDGTWETASKRYRLWCATDLCPRILAARTQGGRQVSL